MNMYLKEMSCYSLRWSGHKSYYDCKDLLELLKEYNKKNNRIAAICAAPSILGNLGLLEGKKAMAF